MQGEQFYQTIIHNAPLGYVLHKVIYDEQGSLADLQFVEVNPAFSANTGLNPNEILGKTITEVIPDISHSIIEWRDFCSEVERDHHPRNYEEYFPIMGRWYKGCIYWPAPGYLISLFYDVSVEHQTEYDKKALIDTLIDVILELDMDLRVTKVYTSDPGMLFLPEEQIVGNLFLDLPLGSGLVMMFEQAYNEAMATGMSQTVEYASPLQADRWFRAVVRLVNSKNGRSLQVIIRDITAQKKAEDILQTFFAVTSEYLCICDAEGNLLEVNPVMMANMGISSDVIGKNVADHAHPEDLPQILRSMRDLVAGNPIGDIVYRYRLRDGNYHYLEWTATAYNGLIYSAGRDITDKMMAAEELKQDNERMSKLVELLQQPFASYRELIDFALEQGLRLTGSRWGSFYQYDADKNVLQIVAHTANANDECQIKNKSLVFYPIASSGIWTNTIHSGQPFYLNDYQADNPAKKGYPEGHLPITRFLSVPVISSNGLAAMVIMANKEYNYTDKDAMQLTLFMSAVWRAGERKLAEEALNKEKEWMRVTLESIGDGVITTDNQSRVVMLNPLAEKLTGWSADEAKGRLLEEVFVTHDGPDVCPVVNPVTQVLQVGSAVELNIPVTLVSRQDTAHLIALNASPIKSHEDRLRGVVLVFRDVTDEYHKKERIVYLSQHDRLTGLYNREYIEQQLIELDSSHQLPITIAMGDVNALKMANDAFGHETGDRLLIRTADILRQCCREQDIIARWGGDEFMIVMPGVGHQEAHLVCNKIREKFAEDDDGLVSISLGYATKEIAEQTVDELLREAEDYMYKRKLLESKSLRSSLIASITRTLDEKNHETDAHAQRLREKCKSIGINLGLREHQLNELELFAMLHDIGKIAVDEHILDKAGPLNDEEWKIMQRHPEVGYRITHLIPELSIIADYILCHHERWDGKGYPQGLQGKDIPLPARILTVVDAYDAMTNDRPYRKAMTHRQAIQELIAGAGEQFDPRVVKAFLETEFEHEPDELTWEVN